MITILESMIEIERRYKNMPDGVSVLLNKVEENETARVIKDKFKLFLLDRGLDEVEAFVISDVFSFNMIIHEEALELVNKDRQMISKINSIDLVALPDNKIKKERIRNFKATVTMLSKEYLRGDKERELFDKVLDRVERKRMRKKTKKKKK